MSYYQSLVMKKDAIERIASAFGSDYDLEFRHRLIVDDIANLTIEEASCNVDGLTAH